MVEDIHANFHRHHMHIREIKGGGKFAPSPPANVHKIPPPRNRVNKVISFSRDISKILKNVSIAISKTRNRHIRGSAKKAANSFVHLAIFKQIFMLISNSLFSINLFQGNCGPLQRKTRHPLCIEKLKLVSIFSSSSVSKIIAGNQFVTQYYH